MKIFFVLFVLCATSFTADAFKSELEEKAVRYFLENVHPKTGLIRDRAKNFGPTPISSPYDVSSIAATGFGLAVLADAAERGLIEHTLAYENILRALKTAESLEHFHGWLYHFVHWDTGKRYRKSEVSTIDTALFLAGALHAAKVFPGTDISRSARSLFIRADFYTMLASHGTLSMGWTPEEGFLPWYWDSYSEHLLLLFLGLAHPRPLPAKVWSSWKRPIVKLPHGKSLIGPELPLFVHQYASLFVDFRLEKELYPFFENSRTATEWDRTFCNQNKAVFKTYRQGFWGLSASDSPTGYTAFSTVEHNGTICPSCAGASYPFDKRVLEDLRAWRQHFLIFGRYGFADAINLDKNWIAEDVIGITVGALYLALSQTSLIPSQELRRGLRKAADLEKLKNSG